MTGTLTPPVITVLITGEIDVATCGAMREALCAALNGGPVYLQADLSRVTFVDAAGIGVLASVRKRALDGGGELVLRRPSPGVRRLTGVLGLDEALPVVELAGQPRWPSAQGTSPGASAGRTQHRNRRPSLSTAGRRRRRRPRCG
jgi:anti-sigma B factor antagonist